MAQIDFDKIRKQVDIVKVISTYIPLTKKGKNYVAVCPFHNDSNPSLTVSYEKQIYKCFSCGASGNVFTFVKEYEGISFIDAVKKVCELSNIPVPEFNEKKEVRIDSINERLYRIMEDLTSFYMYQLEIDAKAKQYASERALPSDVIKHFKIGYAPMDNKLSVRFLLSKGHTKDDILLSGVAHQDITHELVDNYKHRLVFPITDDEGRVVAFSARRIDDTEEQKYINTKETRIFTKGLVLYNYYNAFQNVFKEKALYIVEGFMDAIALYKSGVKAVVATMGTALTSDHINLLKRFKGDIYLMFDADKPGRIATYKALSATKNQGMSIKVVKKLEDKDIDELFNSYGPDYVLSAIKQTESPIEFMLTNTFDQYNFNNFEDRRNYALNSLAILRDQNLQPLDVEYYIELIANKSKLNRQAIKELYNDSKPKKLTPTGPKKRKVVLTNEFRDRFEYAERILVKLLLNDVNACRSLDEQQYYYVDNEDYSLIVTYIMNEYSKYMDNDFSGLKEENERLFDICMEIDSEEFEPISINEIIQILSVEKLKYMQKEELKHSLLKENDPRKQAMMVKEKLKRRKQHD